MPAAPRLFKGLQPQLRPSILFLLLPPHPLDLSQTDVHQSSSRFGRACDALPLCVLRFEAVRDEPSGNMDSDPTSTKNAVSMTILCSP